MRHTRHKAACSITSGKCDVEEKGNGLNNIGIGSLFLDLSGIPVHWGSIDW